MLAPRLLEGRGSCSWASWRRSMYCERSCSGRDRVQAGDCQAGEMPQLQLRTRDGIKYGVQAVGTLPTTYLHSALWPSCSIPSAGDQSNPRPFAALACLDACLVLVSLLIVSKSLIQRIGTSHQPFIKAPDLGDCANSRHQGSFLGSFLGSFRVPLARGTRAGQAGRLRPRSYSTL